MKKLLIVVLVLVLSFSVIVSAQETPIKGGTFRYGTTINPRGMFNPILYTETYDGYVTVSYTHLRRRRCAG